MKCIVNGQLFQDNNYLWSLLGLNSGASVVVFVFFACKLQSTIIHYTQTSPCYDANELDHRKLHSLIFVVALAHREKNSNAPLLF